MNVIIASPTRLRSMQKTDLSTVMEIETLAYSFPWTLQIFQDCLQIGYTARVLEIDYHLVGYGIMSIGARVAHILNLCIHPNLQRNGYGQRLLKHLLILAKQQDVKTVFLDVRSSNQAAINLYHKLGFNQMGVQKNYYPNGNKDYEDAFQFALELWHWHC